MAYWWVSQNQTFRDERRGGYLWAPKVDKSGRTPHHWRTMTSVQPGDIIFSFVAKTIKAVAIAESAAVDSRRPEELPTEAWEEDGYRIDASYQDLTTPLQISSIAEHLAGILPDRYSPLTRDGSGVQGYLFALPDAAGSFLMRAIGEGGGESVDETAGALASITAIERSALPATEKEALVKSRRGQGRFREDLFRAWNGACAVTGIDIAPLLRASHIKPWSSSNNRERLDPMNGLLLASNYDAAFDVGLISFDDEGRILFSDMVGLEKLALVGIDTTAQLSKIHPDQLRYLEYHRDLVFRSASDRGH